MGWGREPRRGFLSGKHSLTAVSMRRPAAAPPPTPAPILSSLSGLPYSAAHPVYHWLHWTSSGHRAPAGWFIYLFFFQSSQQPSQVAVIFPLTEVGRESPACQSDLPSVTQMIKGRAGFCTRLRLASHISMQASGQCEETRGQLMSS